MKQHSKFEWPDLVLPPINLYSLGKENSPCRGLCELDNGKCTGCLRTAEEIEMWTLYDPLEKIQILKRVYDEDSTVFSNR